MIPGIPLDVSALLQFAPVALFPLLGIIPGILSDRYDSFSWGLTLCPFSDLDLQTDLKRH